MRESPILFSAPMVRAILDGRKTVTRRIVKPQPTLETTSWHRDCSGSGRWMALGPAPATGGTRQTMPWAHCPYGQPGDRLWVRETFAWPKDGPQDRGFVAYQATHGDQAQRCWKPSIHMPRWASRITLEVTGVRVERLQAITHEQAVAEGVHRIDIGSGYRPRYSAAQTTWQEVVEGTADAYEARLAFRDLWQSINGPGSWDANPWVWAVEFKRIAEVAARG